MLGAFQIGKAYGIPVRLHWTMILFVPYLANNISAGMQLPIGWGLAAVALLFLSVALHEFGHALVARGRGYPVRDIVLTPIGGIAYLIRSPRRPRDELVIAIAGPLVSLALAILCAGAMFLCVRFGLDELEILFMMLAYINTSLFCFNLIPCFPMDGGRMFRAWQAGRVGRLEATRRAVGLGKILAALMAVLGFVNSHWTLLIIAYFVYQSAATEYWQVRLQEAPPQNPFEGFGPFTFPPQPPPRRSEIIDVEVGPPPYDK